MNASPLTRVRALIVELGLDAVLITSPTNRRYLSGYTADDYAIDESAGALLIDAENALLFTGSVNAAWAMDEAKPFSVSAWKRPWESFIVDQAAALGLYRVGFEDRGLTAASHAMLISKSTTIEWVALEDSVDALRARKSIAEIDELERAIRLTDEVFAAVARSIVTGDTEANVAWRIERFTREMTDGTVAFPPIVASGPHSARPHHAVTDRSIQLGEPVVIDMGIASNGYCGDLTRTIWIGEPSPRLREVYNVVLRAQSASLGAVGPGIATKQVDQMARDVTAAAGYGDFMVHAVGHGLGLRVHEAPRVSIHSDEMLCDGHVITIEPGIYIPDWGGVRIEDVLVVTDIGSRNLTSAEKRGDREHDGSMIA